jgi:hypothetical protein
MKKLAIISAGLIVLSLLPAQAQSQGEAANGCWAAVTREARAALNTDRVSRTSYTIAQLANSESLVTGIGQADGRPFNYRCTYNNRNRQAYAVSLSPEGGGPGNRPGFGGGPGGRPGFGGDRPDFGGNRPAPGGDPRKAASDACYDAVLAYAQRQNPTASNFKIFLSQNRYDQGGREEVRVNGQGELRQMDRLRMTWDYSCTYNARSGRVGNISLGRLIPNR